ncbi:MAG: endonuclease MutS2 [Oscillospiraceae bacterium]|jgi:DNA mismatch repair protein MutS2|nr:endonuclease MutS2 [Oscillospiraceae bacterium]
MKKDYIKLELDKVLKMLADEAYSGVCRDKIARLAPLSGVREVRGEMLKTADAFRLSSRFGTPRFSGIKDTRGAVKRAKQGGSLSLGELLDVAAVLREISALVNWSRQYEEKNSLSYLFARLTPNKALLDKITNAVVSEDEVSDDASPELSRIRGRIERQGELIREKLSKLIKNAETKKFLQESLVTTRDGRFVVPVKTEFKNEIQGLVHDASGSGATLFIEPMGVVEANNEIRVLKSMEKDEIERIVAELSAETGGFSEELNDGFDAAVKLEFCFAKANLGARMKGVVPEIADTPLLYLKNARHPLIPQGDVVPVTIEVGEKFTCLIVTGPNTGGKTAAVKTAGLLALMARCGLMIPAGDGSKTGVFGEIYADIGDEQSIEQSLSTFSSHMNNIIRITETAGSDSLVLLDELGSGTDPSEGGALAVSILDYLKGKGCLVIATTHYQEVKLYALQTDGVENACCEFDIDTLRPTYKLTIGAPGKSNAFAIARRLGLDGAIIERSRGLISGVNRRFEEALEALEASRREVDGLKESLFAAEREARLSSEEAEREKRRASAQREKEAEAARRRALSIIEEVKSGAYALIDELEDLRREKDKSDFSEKVRGIRSRVNSSLNRLHDSANPLDETAGGKDCSYVLPRPLKPYDAVLLSDIEKKGTLISLPDSSGNCFVQVGLIKTKTNASNLRLIEEGRVSLNGEPLGKGGVTVVRRESPARSGVMEIDIRGMTSEEGVSETDLFIDESLMKGARLITVIHGKGTGALRRAVHAFLRGHKRVKDFRLGKFGEGEDGVTVVELK